MAQYSDLDLHVDTTEIQKSDHSTLYPNTIFFLAQAVLSHFLIISGITERHIHAPSMTVRSCFFTKGYRMYGLKASILNENYATV